MSWGGIIAGALGGGGQGVREIAEQHIANEGKVDVARELSAIEEQRAQRLAESAELRRREGRAADHKQDMEFAPEARQSKVADVQATGEAENRLAVDRAEKLAPIEVQTAKLRAEAELALKADPRNIEAERRLAAARHIESTASVLQAQLARLEIKDKQAAMALSGLLQKAVAAGDAPAVEQIKKQIVARTFKGDGTKNPELDYQTVEEETTDEDGNTRKVVRKEVRRPDSASPRTPATTPPAGAIAKLQAQPELAAAFDAKYGAGSAARVLGK